MTNARDQSRRPQQYRVIVDHFRDAILNGELQTGDELPSEAEICEQFHSSRGPVRQAMMLLRTEGLISTGRGRRSTVLSSAHRATFDSAVSITALFESLGHRPGQRTLLLARQPADEDARHHLNLKDGDHVVTVHRVRYADEIPVAIERLTFPTDTGRHILDLDTDNESVHERLRANGIHADNVSRWISAAVADDTEAELLDLDEGDAILHITLTASDQYGRAFEYADYRIPADLFAMNVNSVRGTPSPASLLPIANQER